MATFNVDSLDFTKDEETRFGDSEEYATKLDSANDRLEMHDLTNGTVGHIPRGTGTDLVGGKYAETVSEGKALADNGNVYDRIQAAVDNASSWVKVGPGTFNQTVRITTDGLHLDGYGERTKLVSTSAGENIIEVGDPTSDASASDVIVSNLSARYDTRFDQGNPGDGVITYSDGSNNVIVSNVSVYNSPNIGIQLYQGSGHIAVNCYIENSLDEGISLQEKNSMAIDNTVANCGDGVIIRREGDNCIIANNVVKDCTVGFQIRKNDGIVYGNSVVNSETGVITSSGSNDNIIVNNRIDGTIKDTGTGNVIQDNLTT